MKEEEAHHCIIIIIIIIIIKQTGQPIIINLLLNPLLNLLLNLLLTLLLKQLPSPVLHCFHAPCQLLRAGWSSQDDRRRMIVAG